MTKLIPFCAVYLPYIVAVPALLAWFRCNALLRRSLLLRGAAALAAALLVGKTFGAGYSDVRPFALQHTTPLVFHRADSGFPLWQTVFTATVAFVLMPYWRAAAWSCLVICVIASWARVLSLLNSPLDALGGLVVAAIAALVARALIRRGEKKRHLYPQGRGKGGSPRLNTPERPDGSTPELLEETGVSRSGVTIAEFDSRHILGYNDSIYLRN